jgi:2-methylcitrate dehydratase PrpD
MDILAFLWCESQSAQQRLRKIFRQSARWLNAPNEILLGWANRRPLDAGRKAFLIGCLAHTLELDDLHSASVTHPGCVVVPAAITIGGASAAPGLTILDAVLHGYEACCRIGAAVGLAHYRMWHSAATCGPFGSAMAAAHLLGLDDRQAQDALGNAGTQSAGLWQFLESGAMSKHLHAGHAAEAGITAAELANNGFSGPPKILEGSRGIFVASCPDADPEAILREPSMVWQLLETSIKPWPSCRHTHHKSNSRKTFELSAET